MKIIKILCMWMMCMLLGASVYAQGTTPDDPYLIGSAADWVAYTTSLGNGNTVVESYARLTADIDLSSNIDLVPKILCGELDGAGYTISGITKPLYESLQGATVKNLVVDANINTTTSNQQIGAIAETVNASGDDAQEPTVIENCCVKGDITIKTEYAGGLVGEVCGDTIIRNCMVDADIYASGSNTIVGGFVGKLNHCNLAVENSIALGSVDAKGNYAGGIVGGAEHKDAELEITNCAALQNKVSGNATKSARLVFCNSSKVDITVGNSYAYNKMLNRDDLAEFGSGTNYYNGTLIAVAECKNASNWSGILANTSSWTISSGRLPILKTTTGIPITTGELPEYMLPKLEWLDADTIDVSNLEEAATLIIAVYRNGQFVDMSMQTAANDSFDAEDITVETGDTVCAMLWDSISGMKPLCVSAPYAPETQAEPSLASGTAQNNYGIITYNQTTGAYEVEIESQW